MNATPTVNPMVHRCLPKVPLAGLSGMLTDIDDTLTRNGTLEPAALHALQRLQAAGVPVLAITGRPVGWSEPFVRTWPVLGIVAENGSVCLSAHNGEVRKLYAQPAPTRQANHAHLQRVLHAIEQQVPGALRAQDSAGRETDIAIDHSEHSHLPHQAIEAVVRLMRAQGLTATVSSIHINGWVGTHDKFSGACWALRALLGVELTKALDRWVFVGDSPNDQVMFQHLPLTVGVANIQRFAHQLVHTPRWVTQGERGVGFAEVANWVLAARQEDRP